MLSWIVQTEGFQSEKTKDLPTYTALLDFFLKHFLSNC